MRKLEEKFLKETVLPLFTTYQEDFQEKAEKNQGVLKEKILEALKRIALKAQMQQKEQEDYQVAYIQFSPLQIGVLQETYKVMVNAYDKTWHQGEPLWESFSIEYLLDDLEQVKHKLYQEIKKYRGKIRYQVIDDFILKVVKNQKATLIPLVNQLLKQWDEEESFNLMPKADKLIMTWGDYKNEFEIVYCYEGKFKTEKYFKELLEKDEEGSLIFSTWQHLKLHNCVIRQKTMTCSSFKEACLENITFEESSLKSINFKKALLKNCCFIKCDLQGSDFREAVLESVVFETCHLGSCQLQEVVYKAVNFTDSLLYGTAITEENVPLMNLSDEQLQEIHKEGRGKDAIL